MAAPATIGGQVGRSLPRLEAREKVTGRAEYTHHHAPARHAACQDFPQHGGARPHQIDRHRGRAQSPRRLRRLHQRRRAQGDPRALLRPGLPRPADPGASARCILSASRSRWCSPPIRTSPSRQRRKSSPNMKNCRRCSTRSRRPKTRPSFMTSSSRPAPSPTSSISRAARAPMSRSISGLRRGDVDKAFAAADACVRAHLPHPESAASAARAARLHRRLPRRRRHDLFLRAEAVLRAHRDRAPARLAGKPRARQGAVSRRRLRRQALHQAGSAGGGAVDAGAAAGQSRATRWKSISTPSPSIRARSASRAASTKTAASWRANARSGGTAAPMPISARA